MAEKGVQAPQTLTASQGPERPKECVVSSPSTNQPVFPNQRSSHMSSCSLSTKSIKHHSPPPPPGTFLPKLRVTCFVGDAGRSQLGSGFGGGVEWKQVRRPEALSITHEGLVVRSLWRLAQQREVTQARARRRGGIRG